MKLAIFALVFMILAASGILAEGLEITEIDVHVDYDEAYTYRVENRDRIDSSSVPVANGTKIDAEVLPGSTVTFTIRLENTFQGEDPDINGVFVRITLEDIDDDADLEEESIDFDLEPGDDKRIDIKFLMPLDVKAGTYNANIEAEGDDRNDISYKAEVNLDFEVKQQNHDIRITKASLNPSIVDCNREAELTADIMNLGSNPEDEIALEFKVAGLGVNSVDKDISLKSSEEATEREKVYTKTFNIEVPSFFKANTYPVYVNLYWESFVLFDQKILSLVVKDCNPSSATKETRSENETEVIVAQPTSEAEEPTPEELTTATEEISLLSSPILLSMFLGIFVITALAVLVVFGYFRKSKVS